MLFGIVDIQNPQNTGSGVLIVVIEIFAKGVYEREFSIKSGDWLYSDTGKTSVFGLIRQDIPKKRGDEILPNNPKKHRNPANSVDEAFPLKQGLKPYHQSCIIRCLSAVGRK